MARPEWRVVLVACVCLIGLSTYFWRHQVDEGCAALGDIKLTKDARRWVYDGSLLRSSSVVYSIGLGMDVSFDESLIVDNALTVWGFDPTPKSVAYVRRKIDSWPRWLRQRFVHTTEGLASSPGNMTFTKPANKDYVSMRAGSHKGMGETVTVPVTTLRHWMARFGHKHVDILKMDIEGAEYDVMEDWLERADLPFTQLLVEFHSRFDASFARRQQRIFERLTEQGFRVLSNRDNLGQEVSFIKN